MGAPLPKDMNFRQRFESGGLGVVEKLYVQPTNGSTFAAGSSFSEFHIPGNRANSFADLNNLYVALSLASPDNGTIGTVNLDNAGVFNAIERIECDSSSGVRIFETRGKDTLDNLKLIEIMNGEDMITMGVIAGTSSNDETLGVMVNDVPRQFVLPLMHMSINTKVPLIGNDGLRFRIHWANPADILTLSNNSDGTYAGFSVNITSVALHYDVVKLNNEDMAGLYNELDGRFVITGNDFAHQQESMNATSLTANLGFGRTKCKKIYATARTITALASTDAGIKLSNHSYTLTTLTDAELRFNGRLINEQSYAFSPFNCAIIAAETMKSRGGSFKNPLQGIKDVTSYAEAKNAAVSHGKKGTFYLMWDLTSGLDTAMGESGLDTRTGTFQLQLTASANPAAYIDIFCEYENEIILDTKADNVFRVRS